MTDDAERFYLADDRAGFRQACGDAGRVDLADVLYTTWLAIPQRDRVFLRGTFDVRIVAGNGAHVGVPVQSCAVGRPVIYLGQELPPAELPTTFAHELAHVFLGHCDVTGYAGPAGVRFPPGTIAPETVAAALAAGVLRERTLTTAELDRERAAWAQVAAWGFPVPREWLP